MRSMALRRAVPITFRGYLNKSLRETSTLRIETEESLKESATKIPMKLPPQSASQAARRCVRVFCAMILGLTGFSAFGQQEGRKMIAQPTPVYPPLMKQYRLSGTVKIHVVVGPDGQIKEAKVIGGHPAFVEAALEALKKWKYAPAATETTADLEFSFHP